MEVEDSIGYNCVFLSEKHGTDMFTLIVGDSEVDPLDVMTLDEFLFGTDRADVVGVLGRSNDTTPGPLEVDPKAFHQ